MRNGPLGHRAVKLPAPELLLVEREKIVDYLLNPSHRYGASKARFFTAFGFRAEAWEVLRNSLREHGQRGEVTQVTETGFGPRYEVKGELATPDGRRPRIYTVWQLDRGQAAPRLITAYPSEISSPNTTTALCSRATLPAPISSAETWGRSSTSIPQGWPMRPNSPP